MSLYKVGNVWYVYIKHKGEQIRRSARTADEEAARRFHDELKAELWRQATPSKRIWLDAVKLWMESGEKDLSDRYRLRAIGLSNTPLVDINEDLLNRVLSKYHGSTRNRVINLLHAILATAQRAGWIERVPNMHRVKVAPSRVRWLTADEWYRLQRELPCHLRQMARFAIYTGLRENNVIGLEWSQVNMKRRVAWIHPDQAKARKAIGIPLSDEAIRVLEAQQEEGANSRFVFHYKGKPVTKTSTRAWWAALERAGIQDFTWHGLRHTWASWHVMNGTPLEVLQKLGGWNSLQMVMRYAHLAPEHLAKFANNSVLHP